MEISEIPSPVFVENDKGFITLFLPEFVGEPYKPFISKVSNNTLFFNYSEGLGCSLTDVSNETMEKIAKLPQILVVETDLDVSFDLSEGRNENFHSLIKKAYEVEIKFDN